MASAASAFNHEQHAFIRFGLSRHIWYKVVLTSCKAAVALTDTRLPAPVNLSSSCPTPAAAIPADQSRSLLRCGSCDRVGAGLKAVQQALNDSRPAIVFWDLAEQLPDGNLMSLLWTISCAFGVFPLYALLCWLCGKCGSDPPRPSRPPPRHGGSHAATTAARASAGWVRSARDGLWYAGQGMHRMGDCTLALWEANEIFGATYRGGVYFRDPPRGRGRGGRVKLCAEAPVTAPSPTRVSQVDADLGAAQV